MLTALAEIIRWSAGCCTSTKRELQLLWMFPALVVQTDLSELTA